MQTSRWQLGLLLLLHLVAVPCWASRAPAGVAILHPVAWAPADFERIGAGEFEVLLRIAQLQRENRSVGLVCIGDRHGTRAGGGERALTRAALSGVAVVKLAPAGEVASGTDGLFLDGGRLSAEQARRILAAALEVHGAPPAAANVEYPTRRDIAAIQTHLARFQAALNAAAAGQFAAR